MSISAFFLLSNNYCATITAQSSQPGSEWFFSFNDSELELKMNARTETENWQDKELEQLDTAVSQSVKQLPVN